MLSFSQKWICVCWLCADQSTVYVHTPSPPGYSTKQALFVGGLNRPSDMKQKSKHKNKKKAKKKSTEKKQECIKEIKYVSVSVMFVYRS